MKRIIDRYKGLLLGLAICVAIGLGAGSVQGLVSLATTLQSSQDIPGVPFPSNFSAAQVESHYTISTAAELVNFAAASKSYNFAGVTIHLAADVDYSDGYEGVSFGGIGSGSYPFCGTFEGHGFTVSDLYSTSSGMFLVIGSTDSPATIRNFTLDRAQVSGGEGRAVLVCRFNGKPENVSANNLIENVTVSRSTGSFSGGNCGIIAGRCYADNQAVTISGCAVVDCELICTASTSTNPARWGMVLGKDVSGGQSRIINCTVSGSDIITTDCNLDQAGLVLGAAFSAIQIDGCTVMTSSITTGLFSDTVTQELGGIVGCLKSSAGTIANCTVATTIITTKGLSCNVGLLAGHIYGGTVRNNRVVQSAVRSDYSDGINRTEYLGGLIGQISGTKAAIEGCGVNRVTVRTVDQLGFAGGLVGGITEESAGTSLLDCSATNSYISSAYESGEQYSPNLGGAIGGALGNVTAEGVNVVNVSIAAAGPLQNAGGFAGTLGGTAGSSLIDCAVYISSIASTAAGTAPSSQIGGMVGGITNGPARLWKCRVENTAMSTAGLVEAMGGMVGGIEESAAGSVIGDSTVAGMTMDSTYSSNSLSSRCVGGVIGRSLGKVHANNVKAENGSVTLASLVQGLGGFGGYISGSAPSVLTDCSVDGLFVTQTQSPLNDSYKCYHISTFLGCVDTNSRLAGCSVSNAKVLLQGRGYYLGGLIGSTYSDVIQSAPVHGQLTLTNCAVTECSITTKQSRNCNETGGLVGWLSEGGTVDNCHVSGMTTPSNTNATHVGGLIGYIPESTTDAVKTTVKNCYVENCTLTGKNSLSATIGNVVATTRVFSNNYYYNCTLKGDTDGNDLGAVAVNADLTDGTLVSRLNASNESNWLQGTAGPVLNPECNGQSEVKVMCYNIFYLTQHDSYPIADRRSKVIDLIDSCVDDGVGVIGLQEVTSVWYSYLSDYVNGSNMSWSGYGRYGGTFGGFGTGTNDSGDSFNLILFDTTKYTKVDEGHFWLSDTPDQMSAFYMVAFNYRVVNWVRLRDKTTGEEFFFVNSHLEQTQSTAVTNRWGYTLDASSGVTARIRQAQLLCDRMAAVSGGLPVIILGDWNSYGGTDGYSTIISNGYQDLRIIAPDAEQCGGYNAWNRTDPARFAKGDHIVVSEGCSATMVQVLDEEDVDAVTGYHISDHCPLVAVIRY